MQPLMQHSAMRSLLLVLALIGGFIAPGHSETADPGYPLRGVVTRKLEEKKLVLVQHQEIPGFMRAMTMAFSVPDDVWPQLAPGMHLTATLHGSRGNWQLSQVTLTDANFEPLPPPPKDDYPVKITALTAPATTGSEGSTITRGADGSIWLSWLQNDGEDLTSLQLARYEPAAQTWGAARTVARGPDWFVNWADFPALAVEANGRLTAVWFINNPPSDAPSNDHAHHRTGYQAWFSRSLDQGRTWTAPARLTAESASVEFVSLQPLHGEGVLAVWLDGRAKRSGEKKAQQLYGRVLGGDEPDQLIDDSVCDCCQTSLTGFPNGDVLVAYRARREGEVRDIHTSLFQDGHWTEARILSADDWQINGCPVNGPQLDSNSGDVSAVWFTGAGGIARVYATASPDAGARFLQPQRIDLGQPLGRLDTVQLRDGSRIVTWLEGGSETGAGIWLRRISAQDEIGPPVRLATSSASRASGFPRLALLKDYDATPAQLLLSYTRDGKDSTQVETSLITLPDLSTLANRKPCLPCDEQDANATRGYPIKGRITEVLPDGRVNVKFGEIPGVMHAATLTVTLEADLQAKLPAGQELLGRIEQRGRDWWLFNVKLLGAGLR